MTRSLVCVLLLAAACGDDGGAATVDAPPFDNGSCGDQLRFTGELVDWDSTDNTFCGIVDAEFVVQGDGAMDTTSPNGRFELCIPRTDAPVLLDVTPSAANSQCATPAAAYTLPGIAVANQAVILAGGFWSGRAFTTARQATFFQMAGLTFDPAAAHVVVHVEGATPRAVALSAAHGAPQVFGNAAWTPGATGRHVYFPNVDTAGGTTMLSVTGGALGTGTIPVVAGTFTYVTVIAN
jgi:hypothetical protein